MKISKALAIKLVSTYNQSVIPRKHKTLPSRPGLTVPVSPLIDLAKVRDTTNSPIQFRYVLFGPPVAVKDFIKEVAA